MEDTYLPLGLFADTPSISMRIPTRGKFRDTSFKTIDDVKKQLKKIIQIHYDEWNDFNVFIEDESKEFQVSVDGLQVNLKRVQGQEYTPVVRITYAKHGKSLYDMVLLKKGQKIDYIM